MKTDVVLVGGGPAGLAVSHELTAAGRDHVVLERGAVAESWRSQRWDSLRMITPNWMARLPGWQYGGPDPDGYMSASEIVAYLASYAGSFGAPVVAGTAVRSVRSRLDGFEVRTDGGTWQANNVVVATGAGGRPRRPGVGDRLARDLTQVCAPDYRNPAMLAPGGVLVVGASATGLQIADELCAAGRDVTLSVGHHGRLPRQLFGRDVWEWLERIGWLSQTIDAVPDAGRARREPRLQLVGRPGEDLDLGVLADRGVRLVGRVAGGEGRRLRLRDDLQANVAASEVRLDRLLRHIEVAAGRRVGRDDVRPVDVGPAARSTLDLRAAGITNVVWCTGQHPSYPWLHLPVHDSTGAIRQRRGVTAVPGLYVVGTKFQHRRDSTFLDGLRHDARDVVAHLGAESRRRAHQLAA